VYYHSNILFLHPVAIMKLQVLFGLSAISMAVAAPSYRVPVSSKRLQATLKTENLMKRARQLEAFSLLTPEKNRVFGSPGHNATVNYIYDTLVKTGKYDVTLQPFVETYSQGTADLTVNGEDIDASYFTYIKTSKVEGSLVAVRGLGCELADYPTELKGNIAIVERGVCPFANKSNFAFQAGAVGAIIYNNGNGSIAGRVNSTGDFVPTAGIQRVPGLALIEKLKAGEALKATLEVNAFTENRTTYNVFAQTKDGDQNNVLAVGSHTDSVSAFRRDVLSGHGRLDRQR
jgi:Iap family predicted aminopeptidase